MVNENTQKAAAAPRRNLLLPLIAAVLLIAALIALLLHHNGAQPAEPAAQKIAPGESLVISTAEISGEAVFYPIEVDGTRMEVLAIRASDGSIRTAFNTCQTCYDSGAGFYTQEGDELICNNCGFRFAPDEVEVKAGGCNPWPIFAENKTVTADSISIGYDFLRESKEIFANWKTSY